MRVHYISQAVCKPKTEYHSQIKTQDLDVLVTPNDNDNWIRYVMMKNLEIVILISPVLSTLSPHSSVYSLLYHKSSPYCLQTVLLLQ